MRIYLDIMYSDFWADPQHQDIPAAWQGQDLTQLSGDRAVLHPAGDLGLRAAGHAGGPGVDRQRDPQRDPVAGRPGRLRPTGTGWDNLATLLKAGVAGARAGNPAGHKLLIMMHYDQGGNNQTEPGLLLRT